MDTGGRPPDGAARRRSRTAAAGAVRGYDKVTANCQPGERATGGGAHSVNGIVVGQGADGEPLAFYAPPNEPHYVAYTPTAWVVCAAP
jgi:hypothetical protein